MLPRLFKAGSSPTMRGVVEPGFLEAAETSHARALEARLAPGDTITYKYLRHEWPVTTRSLWEAACLAAEIGAEI